VPSFSLQFGTFLGCGLSLNGACPNIDVGTNTIGKKLNQQNIARACTSAKETWTQTHRSLKCARPLARAMAVPDDCRLVTAMIATAAYRSRAGSAPAGSERRSWVGLWPLVAVSQAASGREFLAFGSGLTTHWIALGNRKLDMPVLHGSCLCGGIKYEITGPLLRPQNCHCSRCRKAQGAAFRSLARVRTGDFRWIQGEELVKYFESSPGFCRGFCSVCGSPIVNRLGPNWLLASAQPRALSELGIALGTLDDDPGIRPERHIYVGSKAPWFEITDDLPQHDELP